MLRKYSCADIGQQVNKFWRHRYTASRIGWILSSVVSCSDCNLLFIYLLPASASESLGNNKANASESLENIEDIFPRYYSNEEKTALYIKLHVYMKLYV